MTFGIVVILFLVAVFIGYFIKGVCIVPQAQRWVVEHLGRYDRTLDSGFHFVAPIFNSVRKKVPICELSYDVPPQNVITKDNVQITADSFIFFSVFDPQKYTYGINDAAAGMTALCISTLRDIIGKMELQECLSSRDSINKQMTRSLDEATDKWGIKVTRVEIKNFTPPRNIMDAMERQMKADREKREMLIRAEAEKQSAIMDAEKNKAVQCLNAEAARDAATLKAEATRIALVKQAEAEREAALLRADAEKAVRIKAAEAEAEAIRVINAAQPSEAILKMKAYDALVQASNGQATKIIIPSDLQGIAGITSAVHSLLK